MSETITDPMKLIEHNRASLTDRFGIERPRYTPPSPDHYPHLYLWDTLFVAKFLAERDRPWDAASEIEALLDGQHPNGFIPNTQFAPGGRKADPERYSYMHPWKHSDYSQPPIMAESAKSTYESYRRLGNEPAGLDFLTRNYPRLRKAYEYYWQSRQNSADDPLIFNTHPHETGRDSDPTFNFTKLRLARRGVQTPKMIDMINSGLDYTSLLAMNYFFRTKQWDVEKTRKYFAVNDVMFNCLYSVNLLRMSEIATTIGRPEEAAEFTERAELAQKQILEKMWFPHARNSQGAFYALNKGKPVEEISVSNLFPVVLPNLSAPQLSACLNMILTSFNTPYPLPSVATTSPNYDPHYSEKGRIWHGGSWMNTNYLIAKGLALQAERQDLLEGSQDDEEVRLLQALSGQLSSLIIEQSLALVGQGFYEFYDPETGEPCRVKDFSWSTIITLLKSN